MGLDAAGLRVLTRAECLRLLRDVGVGRVALSHRALPMILPVHFRLDADERITITAVPGTTLHRGTDGTVVAFEAEGPAGAADPRWSVVVRGVASHRAPDGQRLDPGRAAIRITVDQVTGRAVLDPGEAPRTGAVATPR
jgi:uncharacterized protein